MQEGWRRIIKRSYSKKEALEILSARSRDNSRTPMQWNDKKYAGFSNVKPWIKISRNYKEINVEKDLIKKDSIFKYYQKLIKIRKEYDVISDGDVKFIDQDNENIFIYKRELENCNVIAFFNFSEKVQKINMKEYMNYNILIQNYEDIIYENLRPFECIAFINNK